MEDTSAAESCCCTVHSSAISSTPSLSGSSCAAWDADMAALKAGIQIKRFSVKKRVKFVAAKFFSRVWCLTGGVLTVIILNNTDNSVSSFSVSTELGSVTLKINNQQRVSLSVPGHTQVSR